MVRSVAGAGWVPTDPVVGDLAARVSFRAEHEPDLLAVVTGAGEETTYRELLDRAVALAPVLAEAPGGGNLTVLSRYDSFGPVAVLASALAGRRLALVDPGANPERTSELIGALGCPVLAQAADRTALEALTVTVARHVIEDRDPPSVPVELRGEPDVVATTSGSTASPKAAVLPPNRWPRADDRELSLLRRCRLVTAEVGTYAYLNGVLTAMYRGGTSAMFDAQAGSLTELLAFVRDRGVTSLSLTPTMSQAMARLSKGSPISLEVVHVNLRGERVTGADLAAVHQLVPIAQIRHQYASTEAAAMAHHTWRPGDPIPEGTLSLTALEDGCEIAFLHDGEPHATPGDEPAELLVTTVDRFTGYVGRTDADVLFRHGDRTWVRTGDLADLDHNGHLRVLGRIGRRVKVAGQFVDLDEVAALIEADPGVAQAAVTTFEEHGTVDLVGHVVPASDGLDPVRVRARLASRLPVHMVPRFVRLVDAPPLNRSGKLDHLALSEWRPDRREVSAAERAADVADVVTCSVLASASELLDRDVSQDDDLIDAGLTSLGWIELIERISVQFGVELEMVQLFAHPTPRGIARLIDGAASPPRIVRLTEGSRQPAVLWTLIGPAAQGAVPLGRSLDDRTMYVPVPERFGPDRRVALTVDEIVGNIVEAVESGVADASLVVAGYSTGCHHAQTLAARLLELGREIELLVLLDPATRRTSRPLRRILRRLRFEALAPLHRRRLRREQSDRVAIKRSLHVARRREARRVRPEPFDGRVLVVRSEQYRDRPLPPGLGGPVHVEQIGGDHRGVVVDGGRLADAVEAELTRARAEAGHPA